MKTSRFLVAASSSEPLQLLLHGRLAGGAFSNSRSRCCLLLSNSATRRELLDAYPWPD